jgi:sn-glycerol 3-phosphate transport system ATP-binding protein
MNFLPAQLARGGTAAQLDAGPLIPFADGRRAEPDGTRLTIGVRPEHLTLGEGLTLDVDLVEPLGSETLVHGHLRTDSELALLVKLVGRAPGGESMQVALPPAHLHVFVADSGQRLEPIAAENTAVHLAAGQSAD